MARLVRDHPEAFGQQYEAGRAFFHGPRTEEGEEDVEVDWLDALLADVIACVEAESPMGPLGLRYREEDGFWEVVVYPTPVELVGGAHDEAVVEPGFSLDLEQLRAAFESIAAFGWNALGLNDPEGPSIYVEGVYRGREVYLQVLARAHEGEEPGLKFDTTGSPPRQSE